MSAPRHLWTGDWEDESSAHADGLAARRGRPEAPTEPEPVAPPPRESLIRRAIRRLRGVRAPSRRRVRLALVATFITLLGATAAYAVISDSSSSTKPPPAVVGNSGEAWLGVELANAPVRGALVSSVVHGSPAAKAGIRPGDLITQLDTEPIVAPAVFVSALSGLQPGDKVDLQLQRGASQYSTQVVLASRPARTP
ncbi:MAG TPA: PDZ domain-containing protein [Solirubrobacteraceae bacterium]|nr:PDZ domain-containing protein [Solirubrobacteraceae bacterium]